MRGRRLLIIVLATPPLACAAATEVEPPRSVQTPASATDLEREVAKDCIADAARGVRLEDLTWLEAEKALTPDAVVVIPLGAAAKEHGPHLRLSNDRRLADYFAGRVLEVADVVVAPTITYHHYPAFAEYPGSTSLRMETARDLVVDLCTSLARHGPRRFYVLNTGISTVRPLSAAAAALASEGILLRYTDLKVLEPVEKRVLAQAAGSHADEGETSMILYIDPAAVDMRKAVKDGGAKGKGGLTRDPKGEGTYSPSGVFGDATLATREKGEKLVDAFVTIVLAEIEETRRFPVRGNGPGGK